jgi:hypothetical protein
MIGLAGEQSPHGHVHCALRRVAELRYCDSSRRGAGGVEDGLMIGSRADKARIATFIARCGA